MPPAHLKAPRTTHAQARALERYGVHLDNWDISNIIHAIHKNEGTLVEHLPDGKSLWRLTYKGVEMLPLLTPDLWCVITFKTHGYQRHRGPKRVKTYRNKVEKWGNRYG